MQLLVSQSQPVKHPCKVLHRILINGVQDKRTGLCTFCYFSWNYCNDTGLFPTVQMTHYLTMTRRIMGSALQLCKSTRNTGYRVDSNKQHHVSYESHLTSWIYPSILQKHTELSKHHHFGGTVVLQWDSNTPKYSINIEVNTGGRKTEYEMLSIYFSVQLH